MVEPGNTTPPLNLHYDGGRNRVGVGVTILKDGATRNVPNQICILRYPLLRNLRKQPSHSWGWLNFTLSDGGLAKWGVKHDDESKTRRWRSRVTITRILYRHLVSPPVMSAGLQELRDKPKIEAGYPSIGFERHSLIRGIGRS